MSGHRPPDELPEERRLEVYRALADEQDLHEFTHEQAVKRVAGRFGITEAQVRAIEREGRELLWPLE
jgi:hypothetical protein